MSTGDIESLYKNRPASLWVEDLETHTYLLELWGGAPRISILVAGGTQSVRGLVSKARQHGHLGVFGLSDRDFGTTNRATWSAKTDVFRLEMHEIENALFLDCEAISNALAILGRPRPVQDIETQLRSTASRFVWGMALGSTIKWLHEHGNREFPTSGGLVNVRTRQAAEDRIFRSDWWIKTLPNLSTVISRAAVQQELAKRQSDYDDQLRSGSFTKSFAGKEILGLVESWMLQGGRSAPRLTRGDLIKAIASQQRRDNRVPGEMREIERHILSAL